VKLSEIKFVSFICWGKKKPTKQNTQTLSYVEKLPIMNKLLLNVT